MINDNLHVRLDEIVQSVKKGASLTKEASDASQFLKSSFDKGKTISSSLARKFAKLAEEIRDSSEIVTYEDIFSCLEGYGSEETAGDTELHKAASEIRSKGIEGKSEKVASLLNAATGLVVLRNKLKN